MSIYQSLAQVMQEQDPFRGFDVIASILLEYNYYSEVGLYSRSSLTSTYEKLVGNFGKKNLSIGVGIDKQSSIISEREGCVLVFITGIVSKEVSAELKLLISGLLLRFYDQVFLNNYFNGIKTPVDFGNIKTYYHEMASLLSKTISMPLVAIRQLEDSDYLKGLCFIDNEHQIYDSHSFTPENMPIVFKDVVNEANRLIGEDRIKDISPTYHCDIEINSDIYKFLNIHPSLKDVKTFIIFPIIYGHHLFGVMSCATRCRFIFSVIQKQAIAGLMQVIGVAISNFLSFNEAQELHEIRTDHLIDATVIEVAKSTRHELSNAQAEASTMLLGLKNAIRENQIKKIQQETSKLEVAIDNLLPSIKKLSFGDKADKALEQTSIKIIIEEVMTLFSERIKMNDISVSFQGPECKGQFYSEMLRTAFLNLLLNSIDAFKAQKKRNRKITITTSLIDKDERCQIIFSDNASGLNPIISNYYVPERISESIEPFNLKELIFLPKVSSKGGKGSGWGLYLVRRAVNMHGGSVDLIDYKNGCTFRIILPLKNIKN